MIRTVLLYVVSGTKHKSAMKRNNYNMLKRIALFGILLLVDLIAIAIIARYSNLLFREFNLYITPGITLLVLFTIRTLVEYRTYTNTDLNEILFDHPYDFTEHLGYSLLSRLRFAVKSLIIVGVLYLYTVVV